MNSLYLWAYTWIGIDMPKVDDTIRKNLLGQHPDYLVILCAKQSSCAAGAAALPQLGEQMKATATTVLHSGRYHTTVDVYRVVRSASQTPEDAAYSASATSPSPTPRGRALSRWSFTHALPSGWKQSATGVSIAPAASGLAVTTTPGRYDYELQSSTRTLPPGEYALVLDGRVAAGGLEVGVLDRQGNKWLTNPRYWSGQRGLATLPMVARFTLSEPRSVQFVLQNWGVLGDRVSRWSLRDAELVRIGS